MREARFGAIKVRRATLTIVNKHKRQAAECYNFCMSPKQKWIFSLLLVIAAAAFVLFSRPNAVASDNLAMVMMFEPDEAGPLPWMLRMIEPDENLDKTLRGFLFYGYYYYGFPYFALSALLVLPLQWLGQIQNMPLVMLVLRNGISVLPMMAALLLLVYLQDGFRTYRSPLLFIFLLSVPAVVSNNFWWHPDSLTFLMAMLVLFFLLRDDLRFGRNFVAAAFFTGILTATKLIGLYFFLAVGLTLLLGLILKKASLKKLAGMSLAYVATMAVAFVIGNPFLLSSWARLEYRYTLNKQTALLSDGYGVVYEKGLLTAWPVMHENYGEAAFLLAALAVAIWGAWRGPRKRLFGLILAWFLPLTISLMIMTHFKYQYWLPVVLPLFSCLVVLLPERPSWNWAAVRGRLLQASLVGLVLVQFGLFLSGDVKRYNDRLHRADGNERIAFYEQSVNTLQPLNDAGVPLTVYYDYRMYLPDTPGWSIETNFELLEYSYFEERNFAVVFLLEQRIRDYLNEGVQGIDPVSFARNQAFYRDADTDHFRGYHLAYRNKVGLVYIRDDLWQQYYAANP